MVCVAKKIAHLIDEASKKGYCLLVLFQKLPYVTVVEVFEVECQIPVFSPHYVAPLNLEFGKLLGVEIAVVLGMGMAADEVAYVDGAFHPVAEHQVHPQSAQVGGLNYIEYLAHSFVFIVVFLTFCFFTK